MSAPLPIEQVVPDIRSALAFRRCAVVWAPPGAGKTTFVPLALLNEPWLCGKKIVMLEPRRLAVRAAAGRMADLLGEEVGKTVGYHIRMEKKGGPDTRIEVVTEGILTRRMQGDPMLEGVGLVIFDEFHERNIHSDLGLALCLEIVEALREDLRILVMSATLDPAPVAALMGDAPIIASEGKTWPVETRYLSLKKGGRDFLPIERICADAVCQAILQEQGDILVFLPGAGEIRRVEALLKQSASVENLNIFPLYGNLSKQDQDRAIRPSPAGSRKAVLATAIAETSLTIEGIRIVVDSGLMRVSRFSPGSGMSRLETLPVSRASADQRRGRAGRTGPGVCWRLWSEESHATLKEFNSPEMLNADLARLALELAAWGASDPKDLKFLDLPPQGAFLQARSLLTGLGALDPEGKITSHGKELAALGIHPRLGHMILRGRQMGCAALACRIAAFLGERDFLSFPSGFRDADVRLRLEFIEALMHGKASPAGKIAVNRSAALAIIKSVRTLEKDLRVSYEKIDVSRAGELLALAYPERIAQARPGGGGAFKMASGTGAYLDETDPLASEKWLAAAQLDGDRKNARIYLAAPYFEAALERDFGHLFEVRSAVAWDERTGSVSAKKTVAYASLVLREEVLKDPDPQAVCAALIDAIRRQGLGVLPWTKKLRAWQDRVVFLKKAGFEDLPDLSDQALESSLEAWLGPYLSGASSLVQLKKIDLGAALLSLVSWNQRQEIETLAPTHIAVPSGSKIPLDYSGCQSGAAPVLAVRLQEMFGLKETPRIAAGRVAVVLHLLSPAGRPVQVTTDLASFWKNTYSEVKKDLKGRYPKHWWPDDPYSAEPTNRTRPKNRS